MAYEDTPDAAQILGRRLRFIDMIENRKRKKKYPQENKNTKTTTQTGQTVCAKERTGSV